MIFNFLNSCSHMRLDLMHSTKSSVDELFLFKVCTQLLAIKSGKGSKVESVIAIACKSSFSFSFLAWFARALLFHFSLDIVVLEQHCCLF